MILTRQIQRHDQGFTLIEILVVLVLIGIIASVSVMTVGGNNQNKELVSELKRVHALLQLLADDAVLNSQELGLYIDSEGYRFLSYNEDTQDWVSINQLPFLDRSLPEWLTVTLQTSEDLPTLPLAEGVELMKVHPYLRWCFTRVVKALLLLCISR